MKRVRQGVYILCVLATFLLILVLLLHGTADVFLLFASMGLLGLSTGLIPGAKFWLLIVSALVMLAVGFLVVTMPALKTGVILYAIALFVGFGIQYFYSKYRKARAATRV